MAATATASSTTQKMTPQQQNSMARQLIIANAVKMTQQIFSGSVTPGTQQTLSIQPRYAGLILGFVVELIATITNTAAGALTLTTMNAANLLQSVNFVDLNNNTRINTTGWHLFMIDTVKAHRPYGSSIATDSPIKFGSNYTPISAPATIAASATGTVKMCYWVPLAYGPSDLRGALYANVTQATATLNMTFNTQNPGFCVATGADGTLAGYTGNASATISSCNVIVNQVYYSQLPVDANNGPVLPLLDLSQIYELKQTVLTGMSANSEFPYPYSNFRQFLSTIAVFDNGGTLNPGTDVSYWALQSANFTNLFKVDPTMISLWTRQKIGCDMPNGVYLFDSRDKPLQTNQYGNLELILNPSVVNAGASLMVGTEAFAQINQVAAAGSLAAG